MKKNSLGLNFRFLRYATLTIFATLGYQNVSHATSAPYNVPSQFPDSGGGNAANPNPFGEIAETNRQLNNLSQQMNNLNAALPGAQQSGTEIAASATLAANRVSTSADGIAKQWGHTNSILDRVTSPGNLALLAASAGAGLVVGSAIAGVAIMATKAGISAIYHFLHEKITHEKENAALIADFHTAQQQYEKTQKAALQLQGVIDQLLKTRKQLLTSNQPVTKSLVLAALDRFISYSKLHQRQSGEQRAHAQEQGRIEEFISADRQYQEIKALRHKLQEAKTVLAADRNFDLCGSIWRFYHELIIVEDLLENFRIDMLSAKAEWFRRFYEYRSKRNERLQKAIDDAPAIEEASKKMAETWAQEDRENLASDKKTFVSSCVAHYQARNLGEGPLQQRLSRLRQTPQGKTLRLRDAQKAHMSCFSGVAAFFARIGRTLYPSYFLYKDICRHEYEIAVTQFAPAAKASTRDQPSYGDQQCTAIDASTKLLERRMHQAAHFTQQHAHQLRRPTNQHTEVLLANLAHQFQAIEFDQIAFTAHPETQVTRHVTHGRWRTARLTQLCGPANPHETRNQ